MKIFRNILVGVSLIGAFAVIPASSAPAEGERITYYDDNGNVVGYRVMGCNAQYTLVGIQTYNQTFENWSCGWPLAPPPPPPIWNL